MKKLVILFTVFFLFSAAAFSQPEEMEMRIFTIKHGDAQSMHSILEHLKSDEGKMSVDTNTNSLIVIDYAANLRHIAEVIEKLDAAQKQVEIKVLVTEVTDSFLSEIGMSSSQIVIPQGSFRVVLNLLDTSEEADIRSQMTVKTLSNQPATIQATVEEIFGHVITRYSKDVEVVSPIIREAGDVLEVLPRVNNDGTIMVSLRPSVSVFQEDGNVYEKSILTQVVINNGDTIAIGGVDSSKQETTSGIPIFKKRIKEHKKVVMFLTASISD